REDARERLERLDLLGWKIGELLGIGLALGNRDVAGRLYELGELLVGDLGGIHPEGVHRHGVDGLRFASERGIVRSHLERAARDPHHAGGTRLGLVNERRDREVADCNEGGQSAEPDGCRPERDRRSVRHGGILAASMEGATSISIRLPAKNSIAASPFLFPARLSHDAGRTQLTYTSSTSCGSTPPRKRRRPGQPTRHAWPPSPSRGRAATPRDCSSPC